jgi:hypothetical protein
MSQPSFAPWHKGANIERYTLNNELPASTAQPVAEDLPVLMTGIYGSSQGHPRLCAGEPHILMKSQGEIASLIEMGMRGECNQKIALSLGWGVCTVRIYWIALGMEKQIHQAQVKKRTREKLERYAALRVQIQVTLGSRQAISKSLPACTMARVTATSSGEGVGSGGWL